MLLLRLRLILGSLLLTLLSITTVNAQNPLTDIRFTWDDVNNAANDYTATSSPSSGGNIDDNVSYDIFFSRNTTTENNRRVTGYTLGGIDYNFLLDPDTLALRRLGSASRLSLWIEAEIAVNNTTDEIYLSPERQVPERSLYRANLLNIGYDNVLLNSGTNASNIERIDAIYRTGMATSTPATAAIPIMDRGANGEFKIAMILSLDANGDPASYGSLVDVAPGDFGSGVVDIGLSVLFLQQALGEDPIPTGTSTQALGGTGITFAELGISANQIVYGYSLFGVDVDDAIHTLTDISTFPTNSNNSGLDMAAGAVSAVSSDGNLVKTTGPGGYKAALNTWLKANEGVTTATDASTVTDWQDQSLGDHDATTLINAPTYRDGSASAAEAINFNPTVDFIDATERGLQIANNSDYNVGGAPYTTKAFNIALRTGNNVTTKQQIYEQGDDDRGIDMYIESGNLVVTAYNTIDDSGSGVSSPWNTGTPTTISTALSTETEYIITFEFNGSASGTGTITAYLNGQSFGSFSSVGQLADHSDQIGLGDFNSQTIVTTPASCPVTTVVSSTGVINPNNIIGAVNATYAEVNTNGNIITVDFGAEYPAGTEYSITWIRRPSSTGTAQMVLRESTSPASGFVAHPSPPQVSVATPETDVITANSAFRYIQITKQSPNDVDFHLDAIVVDCTTEDITFDQGDAASFYGSIPEFIYCSEPGSFSATGRRKIESYLAIKYGITLDQSTPINYLNSNGNIIFNTTNNASIGGYLEYNNDIAGIGRDDDSELDQPKSKSENTDAIVTIDRGATISVDDSWLIWGNDNGALTETSALTKPDTIDQRLTRVWRVAERNEVLTTSVSFDITGLGLGTNASDFSLLIAGNSSNADFSNATVLTGGSISGNVITFTGVDLENGQYFTLGTDFAVCSPGGVETNLALWLKADDEVFNTGTTPATDGQTVATWGDASSGANDATDPSNLTTFETNTVNFNPAIQFNNDVTSLEGSFTTSTAGMTMITAAFVNSASVPNDAVFEMRIGANDITGRGFLSTNRYGSVGSFSSNLNEDQWAIWSVDHPSGSTADVYQNGALFEDDYNTDVYDASAGSYNYTLGDDDNGNNDFEGFLGEVIIYEGTLSATDRQKVQSYLAIKYGVTIDQGVATNYIASDGGTIWDATANATYNADIAGIGRDDMSCFEQKQSVSQNDDAIVTMGLGTVAVDNASNANSFASDDSFLMWGNDNTNPNQANALSNASLLPGNVTERMQRVWKADETGTVGATTIEFDLTGLGYSTNVSDFQLIISDTNVGGDLSGATTVPAASLVGNKLTFSNINLTDGQFFTLGTARTQCGPGGITSDLYVWLRADAGTSTTTDNTTLATWSDQSGTSTNATADGNPPLFKNNATDNINFNPTIDFDGAERLSLGNLANIKSGATNGGDYTMLAAGIRQSGTGSHYVLGSEGGTANEDLHFGYRSSTQATIAHWGNDLDATINAFNSPQAPYLLSAEYDGSGRIIEEIRNGAIGRATDANTTDISGTKTNYVGDLASVSNYIGLISEVIVFDNDVTDLQKQQVYTYMALKYGVTLTNNSDNDGTAGETISGSVTEGDYVTSDGSTIVWDYSANTTYHNDVAGIGRDDASCWQQKQSRAEDTDDILTIGLGSVEASNAENANIFGDDHDYLVWGNDNGATADASANTGDVPTTIAERMARVWKVQDTGTVGATELQFDLTGLGYNVSDPNAFSLLIGNTATMADAAITTGATLNGNILTFTGVNLTDGQFFTIGTQNVTCGPGGVNTDVALWLRADLGTNTTTDNANITSWTDQSSPANSATEQNAGGGSPVEPTYQANEMNFNPAIRFSDAQSTNNSWLETASNTSDNALTLISVFKTATASGSPTNFTDSPALISNEAANNDDYALGIGQGRVYINAADNTAYNARSPLSYNDEITHIATGTRAQATTAGSIQLYIDSENVASGVSTNTNLDAGGTFAIGNHSDYDADGQFEGDIAEVLVFDKVLTAVERARVETYLAIKYGVTRSVAGLTEADEDYLAADGGIIWNTDTQGYNNDIFGIGRDDLSCFEQLKSKSINSDALVTMELDSVAFRDNDSFIISGNDNAPVEAIDNTERPAGINSRLNREWRVQETGTVGTVKLTYDLSSITGTPVGANNLNLVRLMVDNDGDFSSGVTLISPSSINGETVTFEVDFNDGQYYTLGSIESDALPITLISFTAENHQEGQVKLEWVTASEINNAFYTVERSKDAKNFETIGIIDGAGNSNQLLTYSFIDRNPPSGTSFYRLKQTDFSGEFDYSSIESIAIERTFDTEYKVYPNPVSAGETLKISYSLNRPQQLKLAVLDARGRLLLNERRDVVNERGEITLSTEKFQRGLNLIRIIDENRQVITLKVIVR